MTDLTKPSDVRAVIRQAVTAGAGQMEYADKVDVLKSWGTCFRLVRPRWYILLGTVVSKIGQEVPQLLQPALLGRSIDITARLVAGGKPTPDALRAASAELARNTALIAALYAAKAAAVFVRSAVADFLGDYCLNRAWNAYFANVVGSEVGFLDCTHTSVLDKCWHHMWGTHLMMSGILSTILSAVINLSATAWFMSRSGFTVFRGSRRGAALVACLVLQAVGEKFFAAKRMDAEKRLTRAGDKVNLLRAETFGNIRTVKQFSCEDGQIDSMAKLLDVDLELRRQATFWGGIRAAWTTVLFNGVQTATWYWGLQSVQRGAASIGDVSAFAGLIDGLASTLRTLLDVTPNLLKHLTQLTECFAIMQRPSRLRYKGGRALPAERLAGRIELRGVSFSYPSRPAEQVLNDVALTLHPGTVTALCGTSGHGKSTIANLVLRLYDPTRGSILLDGEPLTDLDLQWFHRQTAVVSQEPVLFSASIRDNIIFACKDAPQEQVERAARLANAHEFITSFRDGYDTLVGEKGVRLSGGQKQRVAIARAILTDPRVLILDEATSSLDADSEHQVQRALEQVMVGRTTLAIAHRLSTIRGADNIIVIEGGRVVEQGTHHQLLARKGAYVALVQKQLGSETTGG